MSDQREDNYVNEPCASPGRVMFGEYHYEKEDIMRFYKSKLQGKLEESLVAVLPVPIAQMGS